MIDIKTFTLVMAVGNIAFAMLMAGYLRSGTAHPAMRKWKWAKLVQGVANLVAYLQTDGAPLWTGLGASTVLMLGITIEAAAYCDFLGYQRWRRLLYPLTAMALLLYHLAALGGAGARELGAMLSLMIALFSGAMAAALLRPGRAASHLQRIIGVNNLVFSAAMTMRACFSSAGMVLGAGTPGVVQSVAYIAGYLLMIVNGFGFLLLCKEKDDRAMVLLATIDSLTGLVNRRAFFERTESARMLAARLRSPVALMMLDLDHFKSLNDRFGHAAGDDALCVFSATAQATLREHDIMGRLGGEEFALVMPGTCLTGALQAAERLRQAVLAARLPALDDAYAMTVSIGVVAIEQGEHINAALARADHALYAAKSAGRNRVELGQPVQPIQQCA
ncbi:GGDEF domain-containing protein [Massilia antarctica]|uniref:GGDEF domain-containing protein n=1 Tax=Massilia antarctica TaxID=2765360 RepID=UPI0006BB804C|nr:GGDEF domain-containing protein [Massilia sp. H27-R4]CUI06067.1 FOG: GGDEF domain [Janthinobacterium sp. CG23_2]CUU29853.1 FOG: GGDEF domain [Janthinobacterium sp. CG23_2]